MGVRICIFYDTCILCVFGFIAAVLNMFTASEGVTGGVCPSLEFKNVDVICCVPVNSEKFVVLFQGSQ